MSTHWSISFAGSAHHAMWAQYVSGVAGETIIQPFLSFDEPLPACRRMLGQYESSTFSRTGPVLTIEQRLKIDMFLAPLQTWTVSAAAACEAWHVASCFAPRLHRNGEIDFVAPYLAGSQALALINTSAGVTFRVSDAEAGRYLEGHAQVVIVRRAWEHTELLAYLRWRIPNATDGWSCPVELAVFHPTYLRYYDHGTAGCFEAKW